MSVRLKYVGASTRYFDTVAGSREQWTPGRVSDVADAAAVALIQTGFFADVAGEEMRYTAAQLSALAAAGGLTPYAEYVDQYGVRRVATSASALQIVTPYQPYKKGVLLGDSITGQHAAYGNALPVVGSQGFWNWANSLVGAPFDLDTIHGVSGAIASDIFSRIWSLPPEIDTVFVLAGTNDVNAVSSVANGAARDAAVTALTGTLSSGLTALRVAGKRIAIATIPPNNAWTAGDSRIDVLDRVNAWINTTVTLGLADEILDLFTACWDSAQPTARVFKTNYSSDGTHLTNLAGQAGGLTFIPQMQRMYYNASCVSDFFSGMVLPIQQFSTMRVISGISSTISTGGSGSAATDMAGGWRSLRGAGTPTWVCSIVPYTAGSNYVGPAAVQGVGEKFQKLVCTASAAADNVRIQLNASIASNLMANGISYGDSYAVSADVLVESPVALNQVIVQATAFMTAGTSPADQPYGGSASETRNKVGLSSTGATDYAYTTGFRAVLRTRRVRIAENVNSTAAVSAQMYMDAVFNAAGSATLSWGRPQFYRFEG